MNTQTDSSNSPKEPRVLLEGKDAQTRDPDLSVDELFLDRLKDELFSSGLYKHQARTLELVDQGVHTGLMTPVHTGKRSTFLASCLMRYATNPGSTFLYFVSTLDQAHNVRKRCQVLLKNFPEIDDNFTVNVFSPRNTVLDRVPDLLVTTPQTLSSTLLPNVVERNLLQCYLSRLSLLHIERITAYSGLSGTHLRYTLRRLEHAFHEIWGKSLIHPESDTNDSSCLQLLFSGQPGSNTDSFLRYLLGVQLLENTRFVRTNHAPQNEIQLFSIEDAQTPPNISTSDQSQVFDSIRSAVREMRGQEEGNIYIRSYTNQVKPSDRYEILSNLSDLRLDDQLVLCGEADKLSDRLHQVSVDHESFLHNLKYVLTIGFSGGWGDLLHEFSSLTDANYPLHLSFLDLNARNLSSSASINEIKNRPDLYIPVPDYETGETVVLRHLLAARYELPSSIKTLSSYIPEANEVKEVEMARNYGLYKSLIGEMSKHVPNYLISKTRNGQSSNFRSEQQLISNFHFDSACANPYLVIEKNSGSELSTLDRNDEKTFVLDTGVPVVIGDRSYTLQTSESEREVYALPSETSPSVLLKKRFVNSMEHTSVKVVDGILYRMEQVQIDEELAGLVRLAEGSSVEEKIGEKRQRSFETHAYVQLFEDKKFDGVTTEKETLLHAIGHLLLRVGLNHIHPTCGRSLDLHVPYQLSHDDDLYTGILIYDNHPGPTGSLTTFRQLQAKKLLRKAWEIISECDCKEGCLRCVQLVGCSQPGYNSQIGKKPALNFLEKNIS